MRLFRLFTGDDQQSHLEELKMAFTSGQITEQTSMQPAAGVIFTRMAPGTFVDWHNAPRRQYVITLAGGVEIGLSDGSLHRFGPGEGILAEDLTGKGHTTRAIGDGPRVMMIIPLKE
jgi:quercetin dioxygenase-like cupin family protein